MAESVASTEILEVVGKSVQELVNNSENLPKNYIYEEGGVGFRNALLPSDIPVVDFHNLTSPSTAQQELAKLHSALNSCCFQAINHGMSSSFLDKVREVSKQFFHLPKEEKQIYAREPNGIEGYGNDIIYSENQRLDWTDRVYLKVQPEDERNFIVWPQQPNDFRSIVLQYTENLRLLTEVLLRALAKSLNLEEDSFLKEYGERPVMFLRFNYYPPCPMADHVLGLKPHADGSAITFLLQDKEVEGLQVLKDNQWYKVPIIPDALMVNVGDQIEIMSNGIFRSPIHRAVINAEKERLTLAMFWKDTKVRDNQLVDKSGGPISMDIKLYNVPIYLYTSEDVLDGLKFLEVPVTIDGAGSVLHMEINSYIYILGKQIIFIGEKYCLSLKRHSYELFLNDKNFDPLSLNDTNTNEVNPEFNSTADENKEISSRRVFRSEYNEESKKRIHPTIEEHKRRHIHGDPRKDFTYLSGTGSVPAPVETRAFKNLIYHNRGKIVTNGKVVIIIWNDQVNGKFGATNLKTCYNNLPTFYNDLLKTRLFTYLTPGKKGSDPQSKVVAIDQNVHYLTPASSRRKSTLSDSDISNQLIEWLSVPYDSSKVNSTIPKDASNPLNYMYMIFFPSGIKLSSGFCSSYCGFHTYRNSYAYAVLPWVGDCIGSCGSSSYVSSFGGSICGSLHSVASHEMTEIATDPYLNVYYDTDGNENADKCAWTSPACYKNPSTGNSYCVQQGWDHTASSSSANDAGCTKNFQF